MFTSSVKSYPECSFGKAGQLLCAVQQMERGKEPQEVCAQGKCSGGPLRIPAEHRGAARRAQTRCVPCMPFQYKAVVVNQQQDVLLCNVFIPSVGGEGSNF